MAESRCPDCGGIVREFTYSSLALVQVATGMKCDSCKRFWETVSEFASYVELGEVSPAVPDKICKVCLDAAHHVLDAPWRSIDPSGGPAVCPHCIMCPTCGASTFEVQDGCVVCSVCNAYWSTSAEFEGELLGRASALGIKLKGAD